MDYKTPEERHECIQLMARRDALSTEKKSHELELQKIKHAIRGRGLLPTRQYQAYCEGQRKHLKAIHYCDKEFAAIKARLREIDIAESERYMAARAKSAVEASTQPVAESRREQDSAASLLLGVSELRDQYRLFAADRTRVASMRASAAEFANRLDEIIGKFQGSTDAPPAAAWNQRRV